MSNKLLVFSCLIAICFSFASCVSNRAFQTARTTPKGEAGGGLGIAITDIDFYETIDTTNLGGFTGEIFARYGITEKLDIGVNVSLVGTSGLDLKYQFHGDQESAFAASAGAGVGTFSIESGGVNTTTIDLTIPAYFSFHAEDALALYGSPRFVQRFSAANGSFLGILGGTRIGTENFAIFLEYGYLKSFNNNYSNHKQLNVGLAVGIK